MANRTILEITGITVREWLWRETAESGGHVRISLGNPIRAAATTRSAAP
jgi:hypothetical protein